MHAAVVQRTTGGMSRRSRVDGIQSGLLRVETGVVHGRLHAAALDGEFFGALADDFRSVTGTVGEDLADAALFADHLDELDDGFRVAPGEVETADIFTGEDAVLDALDGHTDTAAAGDGVDALTVQVLVDVEHGVVVIVQEECGVVPLGLVFRLMDDAVTGVIVFDLGNVELAAAAVGAGIAVVPGDLMLQHLVRVGLVQLTDGEVLFLCAAPVTDGTFTGLTGELRRACGTPGTHQNCGEQSVGGQLKFRKDFRDVEKTGRDLGRQECHVETARALFGQCFDLFGMDAGNGFRAVADDALQVLGTDDTADALTGSDTAVLVADAGHPALLFTAGADDGTDRAFLAGLRVTSPEFLFRVVAVEAPDAFGVEDLATFVVDVEVDRFVGLTVNGDHVEAAVFDAGGKGTTTVRFTDTAGGRGLRDDHPASHDGRARAGHDARREAHDVFGAHGVCACRNMVVAPPRA